MIGLFIRSLLWFSVSFVVLSIPIKEKPLFNHLSNVFGDSAQSVIQDFSVKAGESLHVGKKAIEQMFRTVPKSSASDKVKVKQSAIEREALPEEEYTIEEREMLKQILSQ